MDILSKHQSLDTVMWFEVSVPVLSEQITLTEPKVSTLGNLLTMALRLAILRTPNAKVTVTIIGNPSGIAATAKDTDIWNISNQDLPCMIPTKQIIPITMKLTSDKSFPNLSIVNCNITNICSHEASLFFDHAGYFAL